MPPLIPSRGAPPLPQVVTDMLDRLRERLPEGEGDPIPEPSVDVVRLAERPVGLGNRRGNEGRGPAPLVALKGGRLQTTVRFQLWAGSREAVDGSVLALQQTLLADREALFTRGFLRLAATAIGTAEQTADPAAWRRTADYDLLYEYRYAETEGAASLIARIPVELDGDATVVTDRMVRWDDDGAPVLEVRRRGRREVTLRTLYGVAFLPPGFDGAGVAVESRSNGILRRRNFASLRDFVDAFTADGEDLELDGNPYRTGLLTFAEPVILRRGDEFFRVTYGEESSGGSEAVVYLRALG